MADAIELDALNKKLLVEQWSKESKKNYLD